MTCRKRVISKRFSILVLFLVVTLFSAEQVFSAALTEEERNNIAVYEKVADGVVNVTSTAVQMDFFFNAFPTQGSGSGSIINAKGYILTNHHVVADAQKLEVTLADGSKWPAKLIGSDPDNDLAVIKIDAPKEKLKVVSMGDSKNLRIGQKVLAIGNPFGLQRTLTTGIISSLGRTIRSEAGTLIEDVIQTDAAINPGNSGGPLLNSDGEIIGINSAILSPSGGSVGIGFAIPVNTARRVVPDLLAVNNWLRIILERVGRMLKPPQTKADQSRLMAMYLSGANQPTGAGMRGVANQECQDGKFAQNRRKRA